MCISRPKQKPLFNMDQFHPVVKSFIAGSFSGTCSTILFQPLDLLKTKIQVSKAAGCPSAGLYQMFFNVLKNEHVQGLWRGIVPSLTRTVPGIGVYFCSLHTIRSNFGSTDPHPLESVAVGVAARTVAGISLLPVTVVKVRYESGQFKYSGMYSALRSIGKVEGVRGLFSGLGPTLMRDAPFSGLYLMFYTQAKKQLRRSHNVDDTAPLVHFSCGLLSGCFASVITQPADVVKTRTQVLQGENARFRTVVRHIYQTEGLAGFMTGVVPRTLRRTLMAAMAWTVYEQVMQKCGVK